MEPPREGRSIKVSELASEIAVSAELVAKLMSDVEAVLSSARTDGLSDEAILWALEDAVAALKPKLSQR